MNAKPQEIHRILLGTSASSTAFLELFRERQNRRPGLSLGVLCRLSGIRSRGYLHDVLSGRRLLAAKYIPALCRVFELNLTQQRFLELRIAAELAAPKPLSPDLAEEQATIRRILEASVELGDSDRPALAHDFPFTQKLLAALALFPGGAEEAELVRILGLSPRDNLRSSLAALEKAGLLRLEGGRYHSSGSLRYLEGFAPAEIRKIARDGLLQTCPILPEVAADENESILSHMYIAVDAEVYRNELKRFLHELKRFHSRLSRNGTPRRLVQVSVQAFLVPVTGGSEES